MKLHANPFHPVTGALLPAYRDAYLRGDLSSKNAEAVDAYVKANSQYGDDTLRRYYEMKQQGHEVKPVGWVQRQFELIRTEPQRFRRRATSLVVGSALIGGAVFAGTNLPTESLPTDNSTIPAALVAPAEAAEATSSAFASRLVTVRGRILNEDGKPLVGATIIDKMSGRGVSTDAAGNYAMLVSAAKPAQLQYGYGGYAEEEVQVSGQSTQNVTLLPRKAQQRHWWQF